MTAVTPRVRDKEGKQRALLQAAADVFAELGYEAGHTREIARRAECSESLIFRYFGDKQGLFEHLVEQQAREAIERGEARIGDRYPDTFAEYVEALFEARLPENNLVRQWDIAARALTDEDFARRNIVPIHEARNLVIEAGVRHYQAGGQISSQIDPGALAEIVANLVNVTVILGPKLFCTERPAVDRAIRLATELLASGVRSGRDA
jgi:AcrR family transcriptional regulator